VDRTGGRYDRKVSDDVVMALPHDPWCLDGPQAREAVKATPRWERAEFLDKRVERPQEGLIVIAYRVKASLGERQYHACAPARCAGWNTRSGTWCSTSRPRWASRWQTRTRTDIRPLALARVRA
jgi:hypothetical protein